MRSREVANKRAKRQTDSGCTEMRLAVALTTTPPGIYEADLRGTHNVSSGNTSNCYVTSRDQILEEIRRLAKENGGRSVGRSRTGGNCGGTSDTDLSQAAHFHLLDTLASVLFYGHDKEIIQLDVP